MSGRSLARMLLGLSTAAAEAALATKLYEFSSLGRDATANVSNLRD